ncbi:LysM peptidoglycan-binding domain-containing protein [Labrys monachus]|uniref:Nucleoid-associated protein YgaU n=1 Tax=Labrys monachus TaxID=217067 RepID=A0ABU0FI23_9HYPH|nr:LysM peptidoglycan-binding domain-containing protein [Labrys monachus]MDQ0394255.1 nucleoid-associated protein YgaU [Labrys monachus]
MAAGWKTIAGIVGAASIVSVGTLYGVLVREPAPAVPASQEKVAESAPPAQTQPASDQAAVKPAAGPAKSSTPVASEAKPAASEPDVSKPDLSKPAVASSQAGGSETSKPGDSGAAAVATEAKPAKSGPASPGAAPSQPPAKAAPQPSASAAATPGTVPAAAGQQAIVAAAPKPDAGASGNANGKQDGDSKPVPPPTFDIVRIGPDGDAVVAGQGTPGATVELLRNGEPYARAVADVGGQWAIVPPALPKGPCELTLRVTTPDGRVATSDQSISVRVPEHPGEEVVVVLETPNMPSRVLADAVKPANRVVANAQASAAAPTRAVPATAAATPPAHSSAATPGSAGKTEAAKTPSRANAAIRTVEADENGRFFVTGTAEPGATIRIYLNDTPVATVTAAKDGSFGLTIEKGMLAGNYRVRVDDVAPATGRVLTRAEVPFAMTDRTLAASAPTVVAAASQPPRPASTPAGAPAAQASAHNAAVTAPALPRQEMQPDATAVAPAVKPAAAVGSTPARPALTPAAPSNGPVADGATPSAEKMAASPAGPAVDQAAAPSEKPVASSDGQPAGHAVPPVPSAAQSSTAGATAEGSAARPAQTPPASGSRTTPETAPVPVDEAKPTQAAAPPSVAVIPEIRTTTIVRGDNLWRISRKAYGRGIRYTWIYDANTDQIRDPNRIYPGQIFVIPQKQNP